MRYWFAMVAALALGCDDSTDPAGQDAGGVDAMVGEGGAGGVGGGAGGAGGMGGGVPPAGRLAECGIADRYLAADPMRGEDGCRAPGPDAGGLVLIDAAAEVIRFGDVAARITAVDADCEVHAVTCRADAEAGDYDTLRLTLGGGRLRIERELISSGRIVACTPSSAGLAAVPPCLVDGQYQVAAAERTAGQCEHPWDAGVVSISDVNSSGQRVRWLEDGAELFRFSALVEQFDAATCAVEAGGTYSIDGARRTQTVQATVDGDAIALVINETQDEPDENNLTCSDAVFMATGSRVLPAAEPGLTDCGTPDAICGDGACTAGAEDCRTCEEDCGCGADGTCGRVGDAYLCGAPCADGACPPGQRCLVEFSGFDGPTCLPDDGRVAPGGACVSSLDCADGFVCSCTINWNCPGGSVCVEACSDDCDRCETKQWGTEVCERDCSPENPEVCSGGTACVTRSTNTGCTRAGGVDPWVCYPRETAHACEAGDAPVFGDVCGPGRRCAVGHECVGTRCEQMEEGVSCDVYQCSTGCEDDSDCAAPLSSCWRVENRDLGYCIPPQE